MKIRALNNILFNRFNDNKKEFPRVLFKPNDIININSYHEDFFDNSIHVYILGKDNADIAGEGCEFAYYAKIEEKNYEPIQQND